ncbi:PCNA-associated factor, partial [Malurus melanocephalus]|uniref:PCNA-associated factor n=1 Tax=Malurus melanocephalus TaxID=175006 RepID=UPI0025488DCF
FPSLFFSLPSTFLLPSPPFPRSPQTDVTLPAGDKRSVGLNRVCVRPVPAWQKGISDFLKLPSKENRAPDEDTPGTSGLGAGPLPPDPAEDGESLEEE